MFSELLSGKEPSGVNIFISYKYTGFTTKSVLVTWHQWFLEFLRNSLWELNVVVSAKMWNFKQEDHCFAAIVDS